MVAAKWAKLKHGGERGNQHTGGKSPIGDLAQTETKTRDEAAGTYPQANAQWLRRSGRS
jgi:hypothetical protein